MTSSRRTLLVALAAASSLVGPGLAAAPVRAATPAPIVIHDGTQLAAAGAGSAHFSHGIGRGFGRPSFGRGRGFGGHGFFTGFFLGRLFGFPGFLILLIVLVLLSRGRRQ